MDIYTKTIARGIVGFFINEEKLLLINIIEF
jgi:hypothetical protein